MALWHLLNLLSTRNWLDVAAARLKEELGRNGDIRLVEAPRLDKGRARHTLRLGIQMATAI